MDLLGRTLDGRYEVVRLLGAGGMGLVYAARGVGTSREVAVKVIDQGKREDPGTVQRFLGEARAGRMVRHPNVVRVHELGHAPEGILYLIMELLHGTTLRALLAEGPLPPLRALAIGVQICAGLEAAHRSGVVHGDLKPENVMLCPTEGASDRVKIVDFGVARILREASATGVDDDAPRVVGSPPYMSPEQATSGASDARGDLYSFGVVLHEMLLDGSAQTDVRASLATRMPRPAADTLGQLIHCCLQPRLEDRPRSAEVLRDALGRIVAVLGGRVDLRPALRARRGGPPRRGFAPKPRHARAGGRPAGTSARRAPHTG